ncbi:MAG: EFR1 family ferrodoxin [Anaerovorax sp.]
MIFYFSGTGNSKWVAEEIGQSVGEEAVDIAHLMQQGIKKIIPGKKEKIGIVFPVYAWGAPELVMEFLDYIQMKEDPYVFVVCTCGEEAGHVMKLVQKKIKVDVGYSIIMPNNYILGFDVDDEEIAKGKIDNAKLRIIQICQYINANEKMMDCYGGSLSFLKTHVANKFFNLFCRNTKGFYVEESCDGCGLCQENCPVKSIKIVEGKPIWGKQCTMCLSCIHRCPKKAIQYGKGTKNKGRYYFKNS